MGTMWYHNNYKSMLSNSKPSNQFGSGTTYYPILITTRPFINTDGDTFERYSSSNSTTNSAGLATGAAARGLANIIGLRACFPSLSSMNLKIGNYSGSWENLNAAPNAYAGDTYSVSGSGISTFSTDSNDSLSYTVTCGSNPLTINYIAMYVQLFSGPSSSPLHTGSYYLMWAYILDEPITLAAGESITLSLTAWTS